MSKINLEKGPSKVLKFAPVKLLVIESRGDYYRTVAFGLGVGLSHMLIGATSMVSFIYSLKSGNVHACLCTFGYQLFTAEAILGLSYVNGWASHLRLKHRICAHVALHIFGFGCAVCGVVPVLASQGLAIGGHGITGHIALFLILLSLVTGPLGLYIDDLTFIHMTLGLSAFTMSSIALCLGFYTTQFKQWAGTEVIYTLIVFVITYTICILSSTLVHGIVNIKQDQ